MREAIIIGAGLAGSEAAWGLANAGWRVRLFEMRPGAMTPAHRTGDCAELVCSNSFRSDDPHNAIGCLKEEMRALGSLTLAMAARHQVPAGSGLAMDREAFAVGVTAALHAQPNIQFIGEEVTSLQNFPGAWGANYAGPPIIIAAGPLMGAQLAKELWAHSGSEDLYFYDSMAPLIAAESIDETQTFRASRYGDGGGDDYINCPLEREAYEAFVRAVVAADKVPPRAFEDPRYFEGCLPIEVMAERGIETLRHGPMKPMGLRDPRTQRSPYAVVQLRLDNRAGSIYNMVGFQTRMTWTAQQQIFRTLPGLQQAEFLRLGAMHRNTYLNAPRLLDDTLQLRSAPGIYCAGQLIGVEGYVESAAMGLYLALRLSGQLVSVPPVTTALGSLLQHVTGGNPQRYEPMNANWGLTPALTAKVPYRLRKTTYWERAWADFSAWRAQQPLPDNSIALAGGIE